MPRTPVGHALVRLASAALAVGGLALAALSLHPADRASSGLAGDGLRGGGLFTGHTGQVILLALACVVGGAALAISHNSAVRSAESRTPAAERLIDIAVVLLPLAAVVLPVSLFLFFTNDPSGTSLPAGSVGAPPPPPPAPGTVEPDHPSTALHQSPGHLSLSGILTVLAVLLAAALVVALLTGAVLLWQHRRRRPSAPLPPEDTDLLTGRALTDAVDSGRLALHGTDARAAVIACYAAMESSLVESGVARQDSDSPADLLNRATETGLLVGPQARTLAALFREARYSSHPMDEGHLLRARAALDAIAAQLPHHVPDHATQDGTR